MILTLYHPNTIEAVLRFLSANPDLMEAEKSLQARSAPPQPTQRHVEIRPVREIGAFFPDGMRLKRSSLQSPSEDWASVRWIEVSVRNGRFIALNPKTNETIERESLNQFDIGVLGLTQGNIWKRWLYLATDECWYRIEVLRHVDAVPPSVMSSSSVAALDNRAGKEIVRPLKRKRDDR